MSNDQSDQLDDFSQLLCYSMPNNTSANYVTQHDLSLIQIEKQLLCLIIYILHWCLYPLG
uniref:Uncharacterized protein n=1 Tax=Romanomermis culicivorax TaxID=13658 RepID=A0A915L4D7_ROMCU